MDIFGHPRFMGSVFGLGFWEIAFILAVALLVFGPSKLPELAKTLGRGLREFRNATDDFRNTIDAELQNDRPYAGPPKEPEPEQLPETIARNSGGAETIARKSDEEPAMAQDMSKDADPEQASLPSTEFNVSTEAVESPLEQPTTTSPVVKKA